MFAIERKKKAREREVYRCIYTQTRMYELLAFQPSQEH